MNFNSENLNKSTSRNFDLSLVGRIKFGDSLSHLATNLIRILHKTYKLNFISLTSEIDFTGLERPVKSIIQNSNKQPGYISILTDPLNEQNISKIPNSIIKISKSLFETNRIPDTWVNHLNNNFDLVIVPDPLLVKIYKITKL